MKRPGRYLDSDIQKGEGNWNDCHNEWIKFLPDRTELIGVISYIAKYPKVDLETIVLIADAIHKRLQGEK